MMNRSLPRRLQNEDGFSMYIVIMSMMVLLTLGAALSAAGNQSSTAVNDDELGVRALQAAEAGAQAAVHRLNLQQPTETKCVTTSVASPQTGNAWCALTASESVGNGASYTYQTSIPLTTGCTGASFGAATTQRCIVSVGVAGGVRRRVIQRIVSSNGLDPFPVAGILGLDYVKMDNGNQVSGDLGTNGQLSLGNGSSISGSVSVWQNAPAPTGYSGTVTRTPTPYVASVPDMLNPADLQDSKTSNDNARLLAGANPADTCSSGSGNCYVNTAGSPRTLSLGNNQSVTLGGGVYNFCQITLGQGGSINIATGAKIVIYIDSPGRTGSGCASNQGGMSTGNGAYISNPSQDPTALQIVIYGNAPSWPEIYVPNNITLYGAIYAPNTAIQFKNNGSLVGGITAKSIEFKNNALLWDARLDNLTLATILVYYRGSWRQCDSRSQSTSAPATGCL